jgi:TonB family protein
VTEWRFLAVLAASLVTHVVAVYASPVGATRRAAPPAEMEWVRIAATPEPESSPKPEPEPEPEPELADVPPAVTSTPPRIPPRAPRAQQTAPVASADPPADPVAVAEAPVELAGVTLTSGVGLGGWAPVGDGSVPSGPARAPQPGRGAVGSGDEGLGRPGTALVPLEDLARPPRPPELTNALRAAYPPDERRLGQTGEALVQLRIASDGRVSRVTVLASTTASFGDACRDVLRGSRWDAPIDGHGAPVATVVRYRCRFETR